MNLLGKLNLILILVFALGVVPAAMISRDLLTTNAETQVIQNARIMMETAMAMRGYTVGDVDDVAGDAGLGYERIVGPL